MSRRAADPADGQATGNPKKTQHVLARYRGEALDLVAMDINAVVTRKVCPPGRQRPLVIDWRTSREGRREVRLSIRKALHEHGLPPTGELFEALFELAVTLELPDR